VTAVFIDTSALVALAHTRDRNHGAARRFLRQMAKKRRPLMTSTDVFDETVTLVRRRIGHMAAVRTGESLRTSTWCRLVEVDDEHRELAWQMFVRYDDHLLSFTDCTSFAIMQSMRLTDAFTFDDDYVTAGFTPLP